MAEAAVLNVTENHQETLISVQDLHGWYGESHVLHGMSFSVERGEIVTLLGHNGAGKSTTLKAVMGLLSKRKGSISIDGSETTGLAARQIARRGIGYVPEERGIFASLSVEENLLLPPKLFDSGFDLGRVYEIFPRLQERRASQGTKLSGGEQQMLAIARILRTGARCLLLDEPTEGLAPVIVQQIGDVLRLLKDEGYTILLVEQNVRFANAIADRHIVVDQGRVVDEVSGGGDIGKLTRYLGV